MPAKRKKTKKKGRPKTSKKRLITLFMVIIISTLISILAYKFIFSISASPELLPNPDLEDVERQVADKIRALRMKVEKNPESAFAWGELGMNLNVHKFNLESVPCYQQAAALDPGEFRWAYYCAIAMNELNMPGHLEWFERGLSLKPNYVPLHILYGRSLIETGHMEKASKSFKRAIEADSNAFHAYLELAKIFRTQGNLQDSQNYLLKALKINPKYREAHWLLSGIYRQIGKPEESITEMKIAQNLPEVTPLNDPIYTRLLEEGVSALWYRKRGRAYMQRGLYQRAIQELKLSIQAKPDAQTYDNLGKALQYLGKFEEAIGHHRKAVTLDAKNVRALNNLAIALFEIGKRDEAMFYIEKARQADPTFSYVYLNLGTFYMRTGDTAKAIDAFRQGLSHAPDDIRIALRLAWLLAVSSKSKLRNGIEAVRLAEMVCEKTKYQIPEPLDVLAAAYAETGQYKKANATAKRAYQLAVAVKRSDFANQIQTRMKYYISKKPFREKKM